jgi:hypothetical protein
MCLQGARSSNLFGDLQCPITKSLRPTVLSAPAAPSFENSISRPTISACRFVVFASLASWRSLPRSRRRQRSNNRLGRLMGRPSHGRKREGRALDGFKHMLIQDNG